MDSRNSMRCLWRGMHGWKNKNNVLLDFVVFDLCSSTSAGQNDAIIHAKNLQNDLCVVGKCIALKTWIYNFAIKAKVNWIVLVQQAAVSSQIYEYSNFRQIWCGRPLETRDQFPAPDTIAGIGTVMVQGVITTKDIFSLPQPWVKETPWPMDPNVPNPRLVSAEFSVTLGTVKTESVV